MTENKDFRKATKSLSWEKDKLTLELEDVRAKWVEVQQAKVGMAISEPNLSKLTQFGSLSFPKRVVWRSYRAK